MSQSRVYPAARSLLLTMLVVGSLTSPTALAQSSIPRLISHQGFLTDSTTGDPVPDGSYDITFRLYEAPSGGSAVWTETQSVLTVGGIFNTKLGSVTPLDPVPFDGGLWLSLQIDSDPEMTDRVQLTSAPYALGLALPFADTVSSSTPLFVLNNSGTSDGILVANTGSGTAGAFVQLDPSSAYSGVYGQSVGMGEVVLGQHYGTGNAGKFVVENPSSGAAALYAETSGTGPGAFVKGGRAEVEYNSAGAGDPHVLIRETSAGDFARLSLGNVDNGLLWDFAAGGPENNLLNLYRGGSGALMTIDSTGRIGIGVLGPDLRLQVNGGVKADSFAFSVPASRWASVHGSAFNSIQDGSVEWDRSTAGFDVTAGTATEAYAPIQIPDNAVLQELSCRIVDDTASENLTCAFCEQTGSTGCTNLGSVTSDDVSGGLATYTTGLFNYTADNENHSYYIRVLTKNNTNWSSYGALLRIVGVSVRYTLAGTP